MAVRGDNSLFFATGIDNSGLIQGKVDAVNIIQSLASKIAKINPFAALAVGAAAAFAVIANDAYKMSKAFESAMAEVRTIANVSDKEFSKLEKNVFGIYKRLGTEPPDKLANGLYEIIGAGFEAGDALEILEISSKAATAGVTETAVASDGLTTILNSFGLVAEDAQEVADVMFATVDRGKISFEELSSQIATVAPLAASSNISFQEVGAAIATLTKQGVPAGVAMTQIRSAIIATNEVLGDGAFKTLTLQQGLQKMYETAGGSQNKLKELAGRIEAVNGILSLAGPNMQGATEDLEAMSNAAGSVDQSFDIITKTTANQWEIFKNRIKATTKDIGDAVLRMSNNVAGDLNSLFESSNKLSKEYQEQAKAINELYIEYTSLNTEEDRRIEILEEIKKINPSIVQGIDDQANAYEKLGEAVRKFNEYALNKTLVDKKFGSDIKNEEDLLREYASLRKKVASSLYEEYADFVGNLPKLSGAYEKELNQILDSEGDRIDKIRKIRALLIDKNASRYGKSIIVPFSDIKDYDSYTSTLNIFEKQLKKTRQAAEDYNRSLSDNNNDAPFVIQEINNIKSISELNSKYGDYETASIKDALKARIQYLEERKRIEGVIQEINSITLKQYKDNKNILKEYLESENKEIADAALKRKKFFEFKPTGGKSDDSRTELEKFTDLLKKKEVEYEQYTLALKNKDDEFAEKLKENYKLKEKDYASYLRNLYAITENDGSKALILQALDKQGSGLTDRDKANTLDLKPLDVNLKFNIDITSINAIKRRIDKLTREYERVQTDAERKVLAEKIKAENKKLQAAERHLNAEKDLYQDLHRTIKDLSFRELRLRIQTKKKELEEKLKDEKKYAAEIAKLRGEIEEAEEELADKTEREFDKIAGYFNQLSDLFSKFGDEDTAGLLNQLSGVASGIGRMASGDFLGGALDVLNSALTVEIVSDTAKFEAAIKKLEKAIEQLDYVISKSTGNDKIENRKDAIKDLEELEKQADLAYEAEKKARKEVKFLGIKLWSKGSGSGTDPAKLEELERKAEEARRKAAELKEQLDQLYTGTTRSTIVDSIISGLKEGKKSVSDFADNFKDLIQNALLQAFQLKYLEKEIDKFYKAFADAGSDQTYTAEEISALRALYDSMISGAQDDINAINEILESTGVGSFGSENEPTGMSGAISTITEDTADVLSGTINNIRIDVAKGIEYAESSLQFLSQIAQNTTYNKFLESIDGRMSNIENGLLEIQAQG